MQTSLIIADSAIGFSFVTGLIKWKALSKFFKLVLLQVFLIICAEITGYVLFKAYHDNAFFYNAYILVDMWYVAFLLGYLNSLNKSSIIGLSIATFFWLYTSFVSFYRLNNWAYVIASITITIAFLQILVKLFIHSQKSIVREPLFWLSISIILYYGCNIPLFCYINYIVNSDLVLANKLYNINALLTISKFILISLSFSLHTKSGLNV